MGMKGNMVLIEGLRKLSADLADLAARLEGLEAPAKTQDTPAEEPGSPLKDSGSADTGTQDAPTEGIPSACQKEAASKVWTFEEARGILAGKVREGYREEIKAILTAHGAKQLSEITDPEELAAVVAEAEMTGNAWAPPGRLSA